MTKKYYLDVSKIDSLVSSAPNPRDRIVIKLFSRTGVTRAEMQRLDIRDIDFEKKQLWIQSSNKLRHVPVDEDTLSDVRFFIGSRKSGHLISSNRAEDISLKEINMITKRAGLLAGVANPDPSSKFVSPQLLRYSFIVNAYLAGVPPHYIQQKIGRAHV